MDGDASASEGANTGQWWGASTASASASTDVMNQLCRVCGEPAAGFHFGAFTCEGCKSFFGRTYSNISSISECKNNGECVINKKNRTSCKACRLRKCLLVGMSKSGSRYGRRSNWFKIHCLLQEQQQQQQHQQPSAGFRDPLPTKSKVLPLWDGERFHDKSRHALDVDNNNKSYIDNKARNISPSPMLPVRSLPASTIPGYPTDAAAAALWAARNSLLPLQIPPHHSINPSNLPPLPVHFLTPPFIHGGGFHPYPGQHTKNFILPFVQSVSSPKLNQIERGIPAATSASSSSSSSSSPSPLRERKEIIVTNKADPKFSPLEDKIRFDKSVALFQALGPVQEHPIDLSVKGNSHFKSKHRRKSSAKSSSDNTDEEEFASDRSSDVEFSDGKDVKENTSDDGIQVVSDEKKQRTTPLDLTTRT